MTLDELAAKVEALDGPSDLIDGLIVRMAYEKQWPLACYGDKPINYDPELWQERHGFEPTRSLDAAITLVPEGYWFTVGTDGGAAWASIENPVELWPSNAATPALAIVAAVLRALSQEKAS
jgi:hypothetical protein